MSNFIPLLERALPRIQPPVVIVLGAPRLVVELVKRLGYADTTCYQMDLFQAEKLQAELEQAGLKAEVKTAPDFWDLPAEYQTALFSSPPRGERELKLDMVEQGFHVLRPKGTFVVLSPVVHDQLFPGMMKRIFGKSAPVHTDEGTVIWSIREKDRARRRHEVMVQARVDDGEPLRFLTRPGVFAYGQMDLGSRALLAAAEVKPGDRVLDLGCGAGAVGLAAARKAGPNGQITLADSNVRAVALAETNARAAGLAGFQALASIRLEGLPPGSFDVVLTNPPYYASQSIAQMFIHRSHALLRPGGRFYLVTKQVDLLEPMVHETFGEPELFENRSYFIIVAFKT
ncbi:MAG TPA: methyltransferase [Gemmataceae bacterium]|jgi:16S rRNA (guanine1207-N2)-methyltransferase|nr:methyltransferase [Gemmataceae bacterium]